MSRPLPYSMRAGAVAPNLIVLRGLLGFGPHSDVLLFRLFREIAAAYRTQFRKEVYCRLSRYNPIKKSPVYWYFRKRLPMAHQPDAMSKLGLRVSVAVIGRPSLPPGRRIITPSIFFGEVVASRVGNGRIQLAL